MKRHQHPGVLAQFRSDMLPSRFTALPFSYSFNGGFLSICSFVSKCTKCWFWAQSLSKDFPERFSTPFKDEWNYWSLNELWHFGLFPHLSSVSVTISCACGIEGLGWSYWICACVWAFAVIDTNRRTETPSGWEKMWHSVIYFHFGPDLMGAPYKRSCLLTGKVACTHISTHSAL